MCHTSITSFTPNSHITYWFTTITLFLTLFSVIRINTSCSTESSNVSGMTFVRFLDMDSPGKYLGRAVIFCILFSVIENWITCSHIFTSGGKIAHVSATAACFLTVHSVIRIGTRWWTVHSTEACDTSLTLLSYRVPWWTLTTTFVKPFTPQCRSVTCHSNAYQRLQLNVCHLDRMRQTTRADIKMLSYTSFL